MKLNIIPNSAMPLIQHQDTTIDAFASLIASHDIVLIGVNSDDQRVPIKGQAFVLDRPADRELSFISLGLDNASQVAILLGLASLLESQDNRLTFEQACDLQARWLEVSDDEP